MQKYSPALLFIVPKALGVTTAVCLPFLVTWYSKDQRWIGAIYGSNLTDEDYTIGGTTLVDSSGVGEIAATQPRIYGAELQYSF